MPKSMAVFCRPPDLGSREAGRGPGDRGGAELRRQHADAEANKRKWQGDDAGIGRWTQTDGERRKYLTT
jgi:hypothetical protein